jgi:uncharacterized protein (TIGR02328 family)
MRLWHRGLIKYLPDNQLKVQWRECALIAYSIKKDGTPNHLLVNRIMEYPIDDLLTYCLMVAMEMERRDFRITEESRNRISALGTYRYVEQPFAGWHNYQYLRVCLANLYEKAIIARGKSRITADEWQRLCDGYKNITGEEYEI